MVAEVINIFPQSYFVPNTVDADYVDNNSDPLRRVYAQYRNKSSLVAWMQVCTTLGSSLYQTALELRKSYNTENVSDELLNVIGRVVVLPRRFIAPVALHPPMLATLPNSPWQVGNKSQMLLALSSDQDSSMSDELFKLGIRAKIVKNNSAATLEDVLFGANFLLPDANVLRVVDNEDMTFTIEYSGEITDLESYALSNATMVPTPQGVKFNGFVKVDA